MRRTRHGWAVAVLAAIATACASTTSAEPATMASSSSSSSSSSTSTSTSTPATTSTTAAAPTSTPSPTSEPLPPGVSARPAWLGTRPLVLIEGSRFGVAQPTPDELVDRRFVTVDLLDPPDDDDYRVTIEPVPAEVAARSTWDPQCPTGLEELRYLTVTFWGFDGRPHTGEMIVNASAAADIAAVFGELYAARFPIEEMRVLSVADLTAHRTGDDNVTTAYTCRRAVGSQRWSNHAFGLAVDINPFHNPYRRGELIIPELAGAYLDRDDVRPGMIVEGDPVVAAFDAIGWGWGGRWSTIDDDMHFSHDGR